MKTYLFDTLNRLSRYNNSLDFKAFLCNKSWWVFNDTEEKTLHIFQDDGTMFVTQNGVGLKGKWSFVPANKSLVVDFQDKIMMFHPTFIDDIVLCLNLDGTSSYSFLIDETQKGSFEPQSLEDLKTYFQDKYKNEIEALKAEERKKETEEAEMLRKQQAEAERLKKEAELDLIPEDERRKRATEIKKQIRKKNLWKLWTGVTIAFLTCIIQCLFATRYLDIVFSPIVLFLLLVVIMFYVSYQDSISVEMANFRQNYPFDPATKFLY